MKRRSYKFYIRKSHRYLGIFIGVQFLLWTLGGLYFSWTNIEEIRGTHLRKETAKINFRQNFVSPKKVIENISADKEISTVKSMRLIEISQKPFYEFAVAGKGKNFIVADALTGEIRRSIVKREAEKIASDSLIKPLPVKQTEFITAENVSQHHEYREQPLPAWAVTFKDDLTVYLSAETGQVRAFRTNGWRVFDFLWMLHTMDFIGRDNINNYLLRAFSILGILTILSGFLLFFVSSRFFKGFILRRKVK